MSSFLDPTPEVNTENVAQKIRDFKSLKSNLYLFLEKSFFWVSFRKILDRADNSFFGYPDYYCIPKFPDRDIVEITHVTIYDYDKKLTPNVELTFDFWVTGKKDTAQREEEKYEGCRLNFSSFFLTNFKEENFNVWVEAQKAIRKSVDRNSAMRKVREYISSGYFEEIKALVMEMDRYGS